MKKIFLVGVCALALYAFNSKPVSSIEDNATAFEYFQKKEYASFGKKITPKGALSKESMLKKFKTLKKGDTLTVKFAADIKEVCSKKGCWMTLDLGASKESFVRFKDYGFFVPLNAGKSKAIVNGKAYIDVVSVDELKHYAYDAGKSNEEIEKIKEPKITYAFQADGVLIEK